MIVLSYKPHALPTMDMLDDRLAQLTEASYALLELIFPRHVIEFVSDVHPQAVDDLLPPGTDLRSLTTHHEQVTILFTDIQGFTAMSEQVAPAGG